MSGRGGCGLLHKPGGDASPDARAGATGQSNGKRAALENPGNLVSVCAATAVIVATTFVYNRWLLDARIFFYLDDWQWLWRAEFFPWSDRYFSLLPSADYNDRPVGAAFIKALWKLFGPDRRAFGIALLSVHAANCMLLYAIARRCTSHAGALTAALLAATWFSANTAAGWPAAVFDLLGATFCLATVLLRMISRSRGDALPFDLAGAACYLLAIRTKEFALGMVAVLFLMNVLVERQTLRATTRQLWPYLVVFVVYAARYGQLLATTHAPPGSLYHLDLSPTGSLATLGFYVATMFYAASPFKLAIVAGMVAAMGVAMMVSKESVQRVALWSLATYLILLGPVLMLPWRKDPLYLYAPHFFFALVVGALIGGKLVTNLLAAVIVVGILLPPLWTHSRQDVINFYFQKGMANRAYYNSAIVSLTPLQRGARVFISGVERIFNPFWMQPGNSLNTAFKDFDLTVEVEKPEAELVAHFCAAAGAKRFLRFDGTRATDVTAEITAGCVGRQ